MKKIIFTISAVMIIFGGMIKVNALVPTISSDTYSIISSSNNEPKINYSIGTCNPTDYNLTLHYILDNQIEKTTTASCYSTVTTGLIPLSLEEVSKKTEHQVEFWLTNQAGEASSHQTQYFMMMTSYTPVLEYNSDLFTINTSGVMINSKLVATKVTDKNIIDKVGTTEVYNLNIVSDDKNLTYYYDKYNLNEISVVCGSVKLPTSLNANYQMKAYFTNHDFSYTVTEGDCEEDEACDGIFDFNNLAKSYNDGYVYFKLGKYEFDNHGQKVKVGNTASHYSLFLIIIACSIILIGSFIIYYLYSNKKEKNNER